MCEGKCLVSIITPSYNTADYIEDTILSVTAQTYTNWEMIIVDDSSTDETDEIVKPYLKDKRIKYIKNVKNKGAAYSRNLAIRESKGRRIAFLDSDDIWSPDKLERQIKFMEENNYKFTYTKYEEIDQNAKNLNRIVSGPQMVTNSKMKKYCWPGCLTVIYDSDYIGMIQITEIEKNNDYAMWLKISKMADCYLLDDVLAKYRKRLGSISNHSFIKMIIWHYRMYRKCEKYDVHSSLFYTFGNLIWGAYKKIKYIKTA